MGPMMVTFNIGSHIPPHGHGHGHGKGSYAGKHDGNLGGGDDNKENRRSHRPPRASSSSAAASGGGVAFNANDFVLSKLPSSLPSSSLSSLSSLMGPPVGTPSFVGASALTKLNRKKTNKKVAGDASTTSSSSSSSNHHPHHSNLSGGSMGSGGAMLGGMSGGAYLHPSGLTPNLGALNLLNTSSTTGGGGMDHQRGYGSGHASVGIAGMSKHQSVEEKQPKKQWKKRSLAAAGTAVKVKLSNGAVDDPYYSTGLTPANNDSPPLDLTNGNTPLSEIGDLNMSSVFSPSLFASPR